MLHQFRREPDDAYELAQKARLLCSEHRFGYYGAWSALVQAWAIAEGGSLEEGVAAFDAALDEFKGTGATVRMPHYLCLLAAIHRKSGRQVAGLRLVDEAAQFSLSHKETWSDAEIERERGELLLLSPSVEYVEKAKRAFERAIEIAQAQKARTLQLRAATSLARLTGSSDRNSRLTILSQICEAFNEGFATADYQQAKHLVELAKT
jgi:predicted ATPase